MKIAGSLEKAGAPVVVVDTTRTGVSQPAAGGDHPPGLLDYAAIVFKFKFTLIAALACGIGLSLVYSLRQTPTYQATLALEVQESNQNFLDVRDLDPASPNTQAPDSYIQVQARVLKSELLLERVVRRFGLDQRPAYTEHNPGPLQRIASKLGVEQLLPKIPARYAAAIRTTLDIPEPGMDTSMMRALRVIEKNLKVKTAAQSPIVELSYTALDRKTPAEFLNALAEEYVASTLEARWAGTERTAKWLNSRLRAMRENLEQSQRKLQEYARSSGMLYTTERESPGEERLRQLQAELSKAQGERANVQAKFERANSSKPERLPEVLDDPVLREYAARMADLKRQYSQLTTTMRPEHQQVRAVQAQIDTLKSLINTEVSNVLGRMGNEYEAASRRESLLASSFDQQLAVVSEQAGRSVPYHMLKNEIESKLQFYQSMLQKVESAGVATAIRASNIRVVDPAREPSLPYRPDLLANLLVGSSAGLLLGIAACFLREGVERRSTRVRRPGDAARYLHIPEFGAIPRLEAVGERRRRWLGPAASDMQLEAARENQLAQRTLRQRTPIVNDSLQSALDLLLFHPNGPAPQVVAIVSALPREGKTTLTAHLGLSLAAISKRVLLIDADLRKPAPDLRFDSAGGGTGLGDLLAREELSAEDIRNSIFRTAAPGLEVLPAGNVTDNIARLLATRRFETIISELRLSYDAILIDTPPVLLCPEARVLGRHADGVVMVVRSDQNPLGLHQRAAEMLMRSGNVVLGTILNDCKPDGDFDVARYYSEYTRA